MKTSVKTPTGRVLETDYTPGSQFVALKLYLGFGLGYPEKLDPSEAKKLARALFANADAAEASRRLAGVAL